MQYLHWVENISTTNTTGSHTRTFATRCVCLSTTPKLQNTREESGEARTAMGVDEEEEEEEQGERERGGKGRHRGGASRTVEM